jgi:hypothetical protein
MKSETMAEAVTHCKAEGVEPKAWDLTSSHRS